LLALRRHRALRLLDLLARRSEAESQRGRMCCLQGEDEWRRRSENIRQGFSHAYRRRRCPVSTPAKGGLRSRAKGKRGERELVRLARQCGLDARRTWQTAQATDPAARRCDVRIAGHAGQVKVAQRGFETLYHALDGVSFAFVRQDRKPWLAVVPAETLLELLRCRKPETEAVS
jgi:hypothetical protein